MAIALVLKTSGRKPLEVRVLYPPPMEILFKYDLDKDAVNFINGTKSKNNSKPTKLQQLYIDEHGPNYDKAVVLDFIKSYTTKNELDLNTIKNQLEKDWRKIEQPFFDRIEKIFKISYPTNQITAYLTTNGRCTYNIEDSYFFVYFASKSPNSIIMHELFHFYTWQVFHKNFIADGFTEGKYNDVKESLTELLNIEFLDLMDGAHDDGYSQHSEIRKEIGKQWHETKDLQKIVAELASKLKQ